MDKPAVLKQNYNHWEITKDLIDQCIDITLNLSQSGHPGGSLSAADILVALYFEIMNIDPSQPLLTSRDRFILSKGHASPVMYATLARRGFFSPEFSDFVTVILLQKIYYKGYAYY